MTIITLQNSKVTIHARPINKLLHYKRDNVTCARQSQTNQRMRAYADFAGQALFQMSLGYL